MKSFLVVLAVVALAAAGKEPRAKRGYIGAYAPLGYSSYGYPALNSYHHDHYDHYAPALHAPALSYAPAALSPYIAPAALSSYVAPASIAYAPYSAAYDHAYHHHAW